ncbi:AGE family epimerase/isomerase [Bartonella sp. HY406]|uniref:D-mannose isomerase n=1 Tax=Bartonella sp. HY406 TaxID=2979331 RepID=UPI0021C9CFFB|nr:AGE family epimerase/isomerase [Bartonella sp. HY406]UXN04465.1 AGE family epimerase/isomerase [Bartonella sp. HY406]
MVDTLASVSPSEQTWLHSQRHHRWLEQQGQRLLDFSKESRVKNGFTALNDQGNLPDNAVAQTIITARMTHAYALGSILGLPGCAPLVKHGIKALLGPLHDDKHGGWKQAEDQPQARKIAYLHAFVGLAASSAVVAKTEGAELLLKQAVDILEEYFWSENEGAMRESFAADWSNEENYRGANSNMHSVEMCMALADVLNSSIWRQRALRIAHRVIHTNAREHNYRVPEHFDKNWLLMRDFNKDKPYDDMRPFGMTPGHFLEWSHLLLKLEAALLLNGEEAPTWLFEDASKLFDAGVNTGWAANGKPGIVYTIDWQDNPNVSNRAHWVQAEAITAAAALLKRTGNIKYEVWYRRFWDFLDLHMIDRRGGSWHNEVDGDNNPSSKIYVGKPDLYHAYQSTLTPILPLAPSLATMLAQRMQINQ